VYCAPGYNAASDMLTRAGWRDDFAMDTSVYPIARDPVTGGRQLEELAFEVVVSESLALAGKKAATSRGRGVRRVFAIDVERGVCLEWSVAVDGWEIVGSGAAIEDRALFPAVLISDLVSGGSSDDAVARALLAKGNPVIVEALAARRARAREEREEGRADGWRDVIVTVLSARGLAISERERAELLATSDTELLKRWVVVATTCASAAELLVRR
jgi:hypothetical protein